MYKNIFPLNSHTYNKTGSFSILDVDLNMYKNIFPLYSYIYKQVIFLY